MYGKTSFRAAATAAALGMAFPANAGIIAFVNSGKGWLAMTPEAKAAYIQGVNDTSNFIYANDDLPTGIVKLARSRCLAEQKTTTAVLADRITMAYSKQPQLMGQPPLVVYVMTMATSCRMYINEERAKFNLPPL